jgi:hypothetical protein
MTRLLQRLAIIAASMATLLPGCPAPAALAQTAPAAPFMAGARIRNFLPAAYHADRQNWAVAEDNRGILYFGNSAGVLEFDGARWRLIKLPNGGGAFALGKAADGRILVGGEGEVGWLAPDASGSMVYVSKAAGLPDAFTSNGDPVIQILEAPIGQVFVSDHWLFVRPASGALTVLRSGDHFLQAAWFDGSLYVLDSGRGLTRLNGGALENVAGGIDTRGVTMVVTGAGLLIPSYDRGIVLYSPGSANPWRTLNVNGWSAQDDAGVTSAVALNQDLVALGTAKRGVALIDLRDGGLRLLGTAEGLADLHVYGLAYCHNGNLWLGLANGVSLVTLNLPADAAAAPFNAWVRIVTGTRDEQLLFGGTYFDVPGGVQQLTQGDPQKLKFDSEYNAFRFDYSANGLQAGSGMEFETYIRGVDKDWTPWSDRTEREFTQLGAGTWVFRVRARKAGGEISSEGDYTFVVRPAWYATWWFMLFQVAFVLAILILPGHLHQNEFLQEVLTTFAVIVPFVYLGDALNGFLEHYYSGEVAFVKVLMSAALALVLDPMQNHLKKHVRRRNEKRRAQHLHHKAHAQGHLFEHDSEHHGEHHPEHGSEHHGEHHAEHHAEHGSEHHAEHASEHHAEHNSEHHSEHHPDHKPDHHSE